jgi:hypothetical protein
MEKKSIKANNTKAEGRESASVFSKVAGTLRTWFDLFMGRPRYKKPAIQGTAELKKEKKAVSPQEDSVLKDLRNIKNFAGKVFGKAAVKLQPSGKTAGSSPQTASQTAGHGLFVKIVRLFIIFIFLLILVYIGVRIYTLLQEDGENGSPVVYTTPTPVPYKPSKPSVYAEDEFILDLEETLKILEREIAGINIRESTLTPPILDFNINFDD